MSRKSSTKPPATEFEEFREKHDKVNRLYRGGFFESTLDMETYELRETDADGGIALDTAAVDLAKTAIDKLSFVKSYLNAKPVLPAIEDRLSVNEFNIYARSIANAYEIADYFVQTPGDMVEFLRRFLDLLTRKKEDKISSIVTEFAKDCLLTPDSNSVTSDPEEFKLPDSEMFNLANEFLLMSLCAVNSIYRIHTKQQYEKGLESLEIIEGKIEDLSDKKSRPSFGLLGLHSYLSGRLFFALGSFKEAEKAFADSADFYSERVKSKFRSEDKSLDKPDEARILSVRRTMLARCLGSAQLYYEQSKLEKSLELLKIGVPILTLDCGKVIETFCDQLQAMATRALHADDDERLKECEKKIDACLKVYEKYVTHSNFVPRCLLEKIRIRDCRTKLKFAEFDDSKQGKIDCSNYIEEQFQKNLDIFTEIDEKHTDSGNHRLEAEVSILRSQTNRHRLVMLHKIGMGSSAEAKSIVNDCIEYAKKAFEITVGMKQLQSESLLAWGQALQFVNRVAAENRGETEHSEEPSEEIKKQREIIREKYFDALKENESPKITATAFLCLTELEMVGRGNYFYAKRYFQKYESVASEVEDRKCQLFAESLRERLERPRSEFFVDYHVEHRLNPIYWKKKLDDFLIEQAMREIARARREKLPAKDSKILKKDSKDQKTDNRAGDTNDPAADKPGRETIQSVLTAGFEKYLKLKRAAASNLAGAKLKKFKEIYEEEKKFASILNSPD
ncbi:MAG TPA: hypothetical protein VF571_15880 [Pyrinomonadaceae bacterium]|jgi:hypothetical protein